MMGCCPQLTNLYSCLPLINRLSFPAVSRCYSQVEFVSGATLHLIFYQLALPWSIAQKSTCILTDGTVTGPRSRLYPGLVMC